MKKYRFIMLSFFFSVLFHFGIQQLDNKYTYNDVEAACGVVDYGNSAQDMHFLTRQWEFYHGQLLTPEMIAENQARLTRYIDIGQFGGFELGDQTQSPHGQATYRLRIFDKANQVRTMQLPEIYSAYKLYVNGVLLYQSGEVAKESYEPEILSTDITFTTKECNELILQVSDYSHYYSGMIYPIAYGKNQKVNIYETIQILTKGLQSFLPLVMGIICLITYLFAGRDKRDGYFVLVCISYLSYILYAMIHMLMANRSFVWYRIEDLSYYLLIYFVLLLVVQQYQYRIPKGWAFTGAVVMAATLLVPTFFITQNADVIYLISRIGRFYKQLFSIIMMYVILKSRNGQGGRFLRALTGLVIFFVVGLNMDNAFWYEPVYLGWGTEIAGFALIAYFAIVTVSEKIELYRNNKLLEQTEEQMKEYIFDVAHDLKAPAASLNGYIELLNSGIAKKQNKETYFLEQMAKKVEILSKRIALLQKLDLDGDMVLHREQISVRSLTESLREKYEILLSQKNLQLEIKGEDYEVFADYDKMLLCIENLLLNAIEYSDADTSVDITLSETPIGYEIAVTNMGSEITEEDSRQLFERHFTKGDSKHSGLGLPICQKIIQAHMGEIRVQSKNNSTTFTITLYKK